MRNLQFSRRDVIAAGASTVALAALGSTGRALAAAPLTVQQVLDRMKLHVGGPWREGAGVDRIIAGSADIQVTGVGTTMMATFDALKQAAKWGTNFVITHESTFWSHADTLTYLMDDPLYKTKLEFIRANNLAVFHFHDHWHALHPIDGINYGTMQELGWINYMDPANQRTFNLPPTTLLALSRELQKKMDDRTMRVVGDPNAPVKKVYESWGNCGEFPGVQILESDADVLIIGEAQDWNLIEYAQDLVSSGQKKGLIVLGHVRSEQFGMKYCAEWLKGFISEVPVKYIPIIEPYWNLDQPVFEINTKI
jgi:putative NIF3 family GTP cyclohydrolase 1 type 2